MITETEASTLDIDWFFTNGNQIGFVASAGGKLPKSIATLGDSLSILATYFRRLPSTSEVDISPELNGVMSQRNITDSYLADFVDMASKGLYAYDKTVLNNYSDLGYHLVATPLNPLSLEDLPKTVAELVSKTKLAGGMTSYFSVDFE